jgi:hypothetical protein
MATVGAGNLTLADWAKRLDPKGNIDTIVEVLNETNEILDDAIFVEGNLPTGHRTTTRAGLPTVAWRMLNYGVQPSKARTVQVTDSCGMLEAYSNVDKALADLNGNTAEFRLSEDVAFLEAMSQEMANMMFYGNTETDPEKILGLSARYDDNSAANAGNLVNCAGTGSDNTSVWLVTWDRSTCHMIFPKGSKAGLHSEDKGQVTLEDAAGGLYEGYRTHYKWDVGMSLRDWRYVSRLCNIDVSDLTVAAATGANLMQKMIEAFYNLPNASKGKKVWYCNKTIAEYLHHQAMNKSNVNLTLDQVDGKPVTRFLGYPVKRCDAILNTESAISFA